MHNIKDDIYLLCHRVVEFLFFVIYIQRKNWLFFYVPNLLNNFVYSHIGINRSTSTYYLYILYKYIKYLLIIISILLYFCSIYLAFYHIIRYSIIMWWCERNIVRRLSHRVTAKTWWWARYVVGTEKWEEPIVG